MSDERDKDELIQGDAPARLRIGHLFLLTAVAAALFAMWRGIGTSSEDGLQLVNTVVVLIAYAVALVGVTLCVVRRIRGGRLLRQPGEWLLWCLYLGFTLPLALRWAADSPGLAKLFGKAIPLLSDSSQSLLLFLVSGAAYAIAAYLTSGGIRWRLLFAAVSLFLGVTAMTDQWRNVAALSLLQTAAVVGIGILIVVAGAGDWLARRPYDWLHWAGVSASAAVYAMIVISFVPLQ